ncbi:MULTISPECIES: DUF6273 domain-containing protein [Robinsoniella]|uniref:DUF6273 domain-containing protein n=1 Tax=Robinsoniella TaxID=588605 RepID=UPI000485D5F4|nr:MULTISPECIES: DUF6273 domain-containing protein [Robinsoniella]
MEKKRVLAAAAILAATAAGLLVLAIVTGIFIGFVSKLIPYKQPETLNELAYTVNKRNGNTVYIREETAGYQPYLVVDNDYNGDGNVLLLRKYVLDERQPYHTYYQRVAYYENSNLDDYLSNVYLDMLPEELRAQIVQSHIEIIAMSAYQGENSDTIQIKRKAFLLSCTEMAPGASGYIHEGKPLKYFDDDFTRMKTTDKNGKESGWWLRSPSMGGGDTVAIGVGSDGRVGFAAVSIVAGVRPAFCLPRDVGIDESKEAIPGEKVYVFK